jgi:tRNA G10  N-methylase Trm11
MSDSLLILGRQPALGLAELESLYGGRNLKKAGDSAAVVFRDPSEIDFGRLGGSVKLCKVLTLLDTTHWGEIERYLVKHAPEHALTLPEGKIQIGLSAYGFAESAQRVQATGLSVKKTIKKAGRSVRLTPNQKPALSSAQVHHNHLTGLTGWELVVVADGQQTFVAQTVQIQDIDAYTLRDRGRPKRDSRVGMLPPKLAQIMVNLAGKHVVPEDATLDPEHLTNKNPRNARLLDPFCGTGVLLQEALLMGFDIYGTDLEPRMIDYSNHNLTWLKGHYPTIAERAADLEIGDATSFAWRSPIDLVACETYLGKPFTAPPAPDVLAATMADCNLIIKKFLRNIHDQLQPGTRLCVAVPAWQTSKNDFRHLPLIDQISDLGYNRMELEHVEYENLLYYRADQVVARELLVLTRK